MTSAIYFNVELMNNYGFENFYEIVMNGEWTMEKMQAYIADFYNDLNGDGIVGTEDLFGIVGLTGGNIYSFAQVGGFSYATYDETDGTMTVSLSEGMVDLMYRLVDMWQMTGAYQTTADEMYTMMAENRTLFLSDMLNRSTTPRQNLTDTAYGILPLPKYNEEQAEYSSGVMAAHNVIAVLGNEVSDKVGAVLDTMGKYNHEELVPLYQEQLMRTSTADSEMAREVLNITMNSASWDFVAVYDSALGSALDLLWVKPYQSGGNLATQFAMNQAMVQEYVNQLVTYLQS